MKVNRLDPPKCEVHRRENPWRGKLIALLLGVGGTVVAIKACPSPERSPSSTSANNRSTTVRQREPYRFVTSGSHDPLRASRLFPTMHESADNTGRPFESEIESQRALMHRLLDEARAEFNNYYNRGELAAPDVEVAIATGVATDYDSVRARMSDILQHDYGVRPPNDHDVESIHPWSLSRQAIEDQIDGWASELEEHGEHDRARQIARAGGSIGLAVRLSMETDRPDLAIAAIYERLSETRSDDQWKLFFLSVLGGEPELLPMIIDRLSPQQRRCAIAALVICVRGLTDENTRWRTSIATSSDRGEIDSYNARIQENSDLITRYQQVQALYASE